MKRQRFIRLPVRADAGWPQHWRDQACLIVMLSGMAYLLSAGSSLSQASAPQGEETARQPCAEDYWDGGYCPHPIHPPI